MKLNRPWTDRGNGQALDRPMGEFVYRIKYEGNEKVQETNCPPQSRKPETAYAYTENPQKRENELAELLRRL